MESAALYDSSFKGVREAIKSKDVSAKLVLKMQLLEDERGIIKEALEHLQTQDMTLQMHLERLAKMVKPRLGD